MRTFHESDILRRIRLFLVFFVIWFAVVLVRLAQLQVLDHARCRGFVVDQNQHEMKVQPRRGMIYDRNGKILGSSLTEFSVFLDFVEKETATERSKKLRRLAPVIGLEDKEVADLAARLETTSQRLCVKKRLPQELRAAVKALRIRGLEIETTHARFYPMGALACHVLGGVNAEERGWAGVELWFNTALKGVEGKQIVLVDNKRREYQTQVVKAPVPGGDLELTIDATIQYIAEQWLAKAVVDQSAAWGTVTICDPDTGDILAMASYPAFDVNHPPEKSEAWKNKAIQDSFAPGSTFKIVTAAAALQEGVVRYSDTFDCSAGAITIGGLTIHDHERMNVLTFPDVLIHSSNVGTVMFARRLAPADFFRTIRSFGIGERTGVDLPAEDPGVVRPLDKWNKLSAVPHVAIGYEVQTTPLQMLMAMNVYATRGKLVRPRLVRKSISPQAPRQPEPAPPQRVLDARLAEELVTRVLEQVVERGTATAGKLEGYKIAGKTGTAQLYDPVLKTYVSDKHIASFVGFVPSDHPALSMIVVLGDPKDQKYYGGQVCAPVFRDIARQTLRYLGVAPDQPIEGAPAETAGRKEPNA